jgi:DNA-binding transcriptional MerR regulator
MPVGVERDEPAPSADAMTTVPPEAESYTIDELASATHVPSRTIRFYQSRGALMAPEIRGRVAYYGPPHVERLKLIAQLQDRGLSIDAIRDLVKRIDKGEVDLAEWLGVEEQLQAPWANDRPRAVSERELYDLAGTRRPGLIADLTRARLVERRGDVYFIESPALLAIAMKLETAGVDLGTAAGAETVLRKHLSRAVSDLVSHFLDRAKGGRFETDDPAALFTAFRGAGVDAVRVLFAREMEQALRKLLESGKLLALSKKRGSKKK